MRRKIIEKTKQNKNKQTIDLLGQLCVLQAWELEEDPAQLAPP